MSKYECTLCSKKYVKKGSLDSHMLICEFNLKSKREKIIFEDEIGDKPTYDVLVNIVLAQSKKIKDLENKINVINRTLDIRKKINIPDLLSKHIQPPCICFDTWMSQLCIDTSHSVKLQNKSYKLTDLFVDIITYNLFSIEPAPIIAINGKHRMFFKYSSEFKWSPLSSSDIFKLYNRVYKILIGSLLSWWKSCDDKTEEISDTYHKRVAQLMNIKINVMSVDYSLILSLLYDNIKRTLDGYEFLNS